MVSRAKSKIAPSVSVSDDNPSWMNGPLEGLDWTMIGGTVPAGIRRKIVCEMAVTWESARSMFTPGWNRSRTIATPLMVSERSSSTSSTLLSEAVSEKDVIFAAISVGFSPP